MRKSRTSGSVEGVGEQSPNLLDRYLIVFLEKDLSTLIF